MLPDFHNFYYTLVPVQSGIKLPLLGMLWITLNEARNSYLESNFYNVGLIAYGSYRQLFCPSVLFFLQETIPSKVYNITSSGVFYTFIFHVCFSHHKFKLPQNLCFWFMIHWLKNATFKMASQMKFRWRNSRSKCYGASERHITYSQNDKKSGIIFSKHNLVSTTDDFI